MWKVILEKGPKGVRVWEHADKRAADNRAFALCDLHACDSTDDENAKTIRVHAEAWYTRAAKRRAG